MQQMTETEVALGADLPAEFVEPCQADALQVINCIDLAEWKSGGKYLYRNGGGEVPVNGGNIEYSLIILAID